MWASCLTRAALSSGGDLSWALAGEKRGGWVVGGSRSPALSPARTPSFFFPRALSPHHTMRRLGAALLLLLAVTAAVTSAEPGSCSNPDKAAGGGAARPCDGSASGGGKKVAAVEPKDLGGVLADAKGVALLLMHKGDK